MSEKLNILVYAPLNLNITDGSAMWMRSITYLLSGSTHFNVDILLKNRLPGANLEFPKVRHIIHGKHTLLTQSHVPVLLDADEIDEEICIPAMIALDQYQRYDLIVVRGLDVCRRLAASGQFDGRLAIYLTDIGELSLSLADDALRKSLDLIAAKARIIFCQTERFRSLVEMNVSAAAGKTEILPPIVPDFFFDVGESRLPMTEKTGLKMLYAGKFHPHWGIEDMFTIADTLKKDRVPIHLDVYGDKIHARGFGDFGPRVKDTLERQHSFTWHGAVKREQLSKAYKDVHIGYSLRHPELDDIPELSTKLLEYSAAGVMPLANRNSLHVQYFGADYPLFANSVDEALQVLKAAAEGTVNWIYWQERLREIALPHRLNLVRAKVERRLMSTQYGLKARSATRRNLIIAGHDLKFLNHIRAAVLNESNFDITVDKRDRFQTIETPVAEDKVSTADVIFCEWALGNAVFYSRNKRPDQKLIVRFHRFELVTDIPFDIDMQNVDMMVFVSEHTRAEALQRFNWDIAKTCVISNTILATDLDRPKLEGNRFNLGIMGILPRLKRIDLALDVLAELRKRDPRYRLCIKGKLPWDLPWIWQSSEQRAFFDEQLERMHSDPLLQGAVVADGFGADVSLWMQKIGFILSTSDIESFHLAGIEGMASRAVPLVIQRTGATDIFPERFVRKTAAELAEIVIEANQMDDGARLALELEIRDHAVQLSDVETILPAWLPLLELA